MRRAMVHNVCEGPSEYVLTRFLSMISCNCPESGPKITVLQDLLQAGNALVSGLSCMPEQSAYS